MSNSAINVRPVTIIGLCLFAVLVSQASPGLASPTRVPPSAAVAFQVHAKKSGTWTGIDANVVMYEPPVSLTGNRFAAVPIAITNYSSGSSLTFLEVGPVKDCNSGRSCTLRPYWSYCKSGGTCAYLEDSSRTFASGGTYGFKVDKTSVANEFQGIICSVGCGAIVTVDLGVATLPYVFTAVEGSGASPQARAGRPVRISVPKAKSGTGVWSDWCYDSSGAWQPDGQIYPNPCGTPTDGWELRNGFPLYMAVSMK